MRTPRAVSDLEMCLSPVHRRECEMMGTCSGAARAVLGATAALTLSASAGMAQCRNPAWTNEFAAPGSGLSSPHGWLLETYDADGAGPARPQLYVAGGLQGAGGVVTKGIVRWDGTQ